ncbi:hypothetical protein BV25DRAFT_1835456 [Artomyces pyxidatus]|uniref:Uncharacterized protein n=1 Tax=Artomyces pyxidatus TaxID=48021 RepID=A0ACB8TFK0_9AGAM|nr:hypothetical protein BV25DRAFT_1835456 [Artomyces pyxidatus]
MLTEARAICAECSIEDENSGDDAGMQYPRTSAQESLNTLSEADALCVELCQGSSSVVSKTKKVDMMKACSIHVYQGSTSNLHGTEARLRHKIEDGGDNEGIQYPRTSARKSLDTLTEAGANASRCVKVARQLLYATSMLNEGHGAASRPILAVSTCIGSLELQHAHS